MEKILAMNVGVLAALSPKVRDYIVSRKPEAMKLEFINEDSVSSYDFDDLDVLICNKIPYESIAALRKPLLVQIPWSGVDHLDFGFFKSDSRLTVCNSHAHAEAVAEHTWALLMDLSKKITENHLRLKKGDWSGRNSAEGYSMRLRGKTLLVVGLGSIGARISRMGHAFGMRVIGIKRHPTTVPPGCEVENVLGHTQLETALPSADLVVLCLPSTQETKNLFGPFMLSCLKPSSLVVSVSRPNVMDYNALFKMLKDKRLAGAALDNWTHERMGGAMALIEDPPFYKLENVVLSPHRAFRIQESGFDQWADVIENASRVFEGKNPRNVVDLELQY